MAKRKKVSWLGNRHKNEFHRIVEGETHDPRCRLEQIQAKHKRPSKTAWFLRALGMDAAKFCNVRFVSRENT
jgi:hypothetical protein